MLSFSVRSVENIAQLCHHLNLYLAPPLQLPDVSINLVTTGMYMDSEMFSWCISKLSFEGFKRQSRHLYSHMLF